MLEPLAEFGRLPTEVAKIEHAGRLFRTATEISPERHFEMQSAFQQFVDNAVSKTVNLPKDASPQNVEDVFRKAWRLRLKGVTVFRTGSDRPEVVKSGL